MAPPGGAGAPTGCFKCGRPGHWSRDCPSSSSSLDPSPSQQQQQQQQRKQQYGASDTSWKSAKPPLKPSASAKPRLPRKRPNLTPDLLLSNDGIGYVLEHFPRMVKIQGPGHEVDDLKAFLEAYVHWHSLILPYFSFNQFVEKVAKVGSSKRVRMCVNDLKEKVAKGDDLKLTLEGNASGFAEDDQGSPFDPELQTDGGELAVETLPTTDVNEDLFDEFYKTATDNSGELASQTTPFSVSLSKSNVTSPANSVPNVSSSISEDQKLRMEANRLKALERSKARAAECLATC